MCVCVGGGEAVMRCYYALLAEVHQAYRSCDLLACVALHEEQPIMPFIAYAKFDNYWNNVNEW